MAYRVTATRTDEPNNNESQRVAVRDGVKYRVRGTVPVYGESRNIGAYVGDARVEQTMGFARELLMGQRVAKIEIIVIESKKQRRK